MKTTLRWILTVLCATSFAWAQTPDIILYNGKIFTSNEEHLWVEALAIRGERVSTIGTNEAIREMAGAQTTQYDLGGKTVVPGFNDAHWHQGLRTPVRSFSAPSPPGPFPDPTFTDLLAALSAAAATTPTDQVLQTTVGTRVMDDAEATRFALDRAAPNHQVWVAFTGHGRLLNTAALRAIGIGEEEADPVGGLYGRVDGSHRLDGRVYGYADFNAFKCQQADMTESVAVGRIRTTVTNALQFGITSIQDMPNLPPKQVVQLLAAADVPIRWRVIRNLPSQQLTCPGVEDWSDPAGPLHPMVTLSGTKWFVDGTPAERFMATWQPYVEFPNWFGWLYLGFDQIDALIADTFARQEQLLFHVSGDRAADNLFLALIALGSSRSWRDLRPRLEHGGMLSRSQLDLIRQLGIVVVYTPFTSNPLTLERASDQMGKLHVTKSILAAGIPLAIGSDGPSGPMNPFQNIQSAMIHIDNPPEALTREQAVIAYTAGSAFAEMAEKQKGMLLPGMLADLAVLSQDIFTIPLDQLPAVRSVLTMVGGKIVYQAEPH